jgi:hypothetical protein
MLPLENSHPRALPDEVFVCWGGGGGIVVARCAFSRVEYGVMLLRSLAPAINDDW